MTKYLLEELYNDNIIVFNLLIFNIKSIKISLINIGTKK